MEPWRAPPAWATSSPATAASWQRRHQHLLQFLPHQSTVCNGKLYFGATNATYGFELFVYDGVTFPTAPVKDIVSGTGGSYVGGLTAVGTSLYFPPTTPPTDMNSGERPTAPAPTR